MPLPDEFLQELKMRSDISDVVSSYVNLKRSGRNLVGLCPFHSEKSPSFNVYTENGSFYCFGCGVGGDVITFIKRIENLDYIDAVKFLAQRAGLEMPENSYDNGMSKLRSRIYEANREAARFFHKQLYTDNGAYALSYLKGRALSAATIKHFGLGYSPSSRFELVNFLRSKGFKDNELIAANLAIQTRNGNAMDRFSDRVMFPIIDLRGNVIGFGGRIMSDIKPKYLNTSDTPVFKKSTNLFALQFAKNVSNGQLILAEGYMDVIALHQAGFRNAVATLGTSLTKEQAIIIKKYADEVVICYDADEAGQKATARAISLLRPTGINIRVLTVPSGKDPDEFIRSYGEQGPARFKRLLENSGNDVEYQLQKAKTMFNFELTEDRVAYLMQAVKILADIADDIERDIYASKLSEELNVEKSAIVSQINKLLNGKRRTKEKSELREIQAETSARGDKINPDKANNLRAANAEERLIAVLINNPDLADNILSKITPDVMPTAFNRKVFESIMKRLIEGKSATLADISGEFSNDEMSRIANILSSHLRENDPAGVAEDCINVLLEERDKITPKQAATADMDAILGEIERLKKKKS